MTKRKKIFYFILILLVAGALFFRSRMEDLYLKYQQNILDFTKTAQDLVTAKIEKNISAPPPLRAAADALNSRLTKSGTIQWTNNNRRDNGLPALAENKKLDEAALKKAKDMFERQYFEHVSPSGKGPEDLAGDVGYDYLSIGENLALGNFGGDKDLLEAWMASPGHRENILNKGFTEIGVAVIPGRYEGKDTWIAVQEFGSPISLCPAVDSSAKNQIEENNKVISSLSASLAAKRNEINSASSNDGQLGPKIKEYNSAVNNYNSLLAKTKTLVENYNRQVSDFNSCVKSKAN